MRANPGEPGDIAFEFYRHINGDSPKDTARFRAFVQHYVGRRVKVRVVGFRGDADDPSNRIGRMNVTRVIDLDTYDDFLYALRSALKAAYKRESEAELIVSAITIENATDADDDAEEALA